MQLFRNWLVQVLVICMMTAPCLGCTPAKTPCLLINTVPRGGFNDFHGWCDGVDGVYPSEEKCKIKSGDSFSIEENACDGNGSTKGRPILLDNTEVYPVSDIQFNCSDTGVLSAYADHAVVDSDVRRTDCHSTLADHSCPFTIDPGLWQLCANNFKGDEIPCSNGVCRPVDGQSFTIPQDACRMSSQNRPLLLNGNEVPPVMTITQDTIFECKNTNLTSTGGSPSSVDVNAIACGTSCPYALGSPTNPGNIGCGSIGPNPTCLLEESVVPILEGSLCGSGGSKLITVVDENGNTLKIATDANADDTFEFQCQHGHLTIVHADPGGLTTTFMNVAVFSCEFACAVEIDNGPWQLSTDDFTGDTIFCRNGVCYPTDLQTFTIPADACRLNEQDRPLLLNGDHSLSATVAPTTFLCSNMILTSTGGAPSSTDVNKIACGTDCPYTLFRIDGTGVSPSVIGCSASGTDIACRLAEPGYIGTIDEGNLCGTGGGKLVTVDPHAPITTTLAGNDKFNFICCDGHLTVHHLDPSSGVKTVFRDVEKFGCTA